MKDLLLEACQLNSGPDVACAAHLHLMTIQRLSTFAQKLDSYVAPA